MTTSRPRRFLVGRLALSLVVCGASWTATPVAAAQDQSVFVGFTDLEGAPVTDITAEDVAILWDGVACEILELEPINCPVRVTVWVDNATESVAALPDMREGLRLFLDALPPDIEVAIGSLSGRPQFRSPYTTDRGELTDAIGTIAPEGASAAFFAALYEEAERMHEDEDRQYTPVIVMVAAAGSEGSSRVTPKRFERMMDRLSGNAATVHTLLFRAPYGVGKQMGQNQAMWGNDIAVTTGGRFESVLTSTVYRTLLPEIAKDLARKNKLVSHQYRVVYKPPKDASDQPRIQMKSKRGGLNAFISLNGNVP